MEEMFYLDGLVLKSRERKVIKTTSRTQRDKRQQEMAEIIQDYISDGFIARHSFVSGESLSKDRATYTLSFFDTRLRPLTTGEEAILLQSLNKRAE